MTARSSIASSLLMLALVACTSPDDVVMEFDSRTMTSFEGGGTQYGATIDGVMWYWSVSWDDVKDTPDWIPGDEPAISVAKATELARMEMTRYDEAVDAYELDGVQVSPITQCCQNKGRKWIYVVSFERKERFPSGARGTMTIPVLLNGRVIAGVKEGTTVSKP